MRNTVLTALASVLLTAALGLLLWPRQEVQAQHPAKGWEYKLVHFDLLTPPPEDLRKETLERAAARGAENYNKLSADGWEFVGTSQGNTFFAVWKRPRR